MLVPAKPLIFVGAGGHATVLLAMTKLMQYEVLGVCCPHLAASGQLHWNDVPVLGGDEVINSLDPNQVLLINAVGMMPRSRIRITLFNSAKAKGFQFFNLVHPTAFIDQSVRLGEGIQVMAGAVIQVNTTIADNCIVNTNSTIEHDCHIASHNHIAPGATLCGAVATGSEVFIGANSTVIQQISIGDGAVIAAGSVVVKDVADNSTYYRRRECPGDSK